MASGYNCLAYNRRAYINSCSQSGAGRATTRFRNIYRLKVDGNSFEFRSLADAIAFLERAKQAAARLALETRRKATELQSKQATPVRVEPLALPKIEASSRDLRAAVTETKREIAKTYRQAELDLEIALLLELADREKHNEEVIWLLM